jgi:pimeloyl-ACP methyl ester carboxylesterase
VWRLFAGSLAAVFLLVGWARTHQLEPARENGVLDITPPTPFYRYLPAGKPYGRALVVHGLDSNKEFMQIFCAALADAGFEAYAIDLPGHGDSTVPFNTLDASRTIENAVERLKPDTIVGHSLGAGLILDLADRLPFQSLVLISPAPVPVPLDDTKLRHILVTTGRFDIPAIKQFVPRLGNADRMEFKWAMHSSVPQSPGDIREIIQWLGRDTSGLRTTQRLTWVGLMFASGLTLGMTMLPHRKKQTRLKILSGTEVIVAFVFACVLSVFVLQFIVVLRWIRLFTADYLVSFIFVGGMVLTTLLMWHRNRKGFVVKDEMGFHVIPCLIGVAAAAYVIVVIGLLTASHLIHMSLSAGRFWRFPIIAAAAFPLFVFDEAVTRQVPGIWKRMSLGILTRCLLAASVATGVLTLNRESSFLALLAIMILLFWLALWFVTGIVSRRIQDPIAAALFAALVQGWMFAAWFVAA